MSPSPPGAEHPTSRAVCTILAGPNGSGKSSIFPALDLPGRFINTDLVARTLDPAHPERASFAAGKQVLRELEQTLRTGQDFVYETTLASHQALELIRRARAAGYEVGIVYVTLRNPTLNVARVAQRVAAGGHSIPEHVVRRRYETSMLSLVEGIRLAHGTMIFDNSEITGPVLLIQVSRATVQINNLDPVHPFHTRIASIVANTLGIGIDAVLHATRPS